MPGVSGGIRVAAAVLLLGLSPSAWADVAKAKAHYERGMALYQVGEYRRALDEFKEAHVEKPDPAFLYNIAQSYRQLGERENALVFYRRFLSMGPDSPLRPDVERRIKELESSAASPPPSVPRAETSPPPPARPRLVMETAPSSEQGPRLPVPRWVPWTAAGITLAVGTVALVSSLSTSNRYSELRDTCGQTPEGCTPSQVYDLRSRARTANVLWALTGVAAVGTGATIYLNTREAGIAGLWRF